MRVITPPDKSGAGALVCAIRRRFLGEHSAHKDVLAQSQKTGHLYYACIRCGRVSSR